MSTEDINYSNLVGGKRKNGHKLDCDCHICENMENKAKRGGYKEEMEKEQENMIGGPKKKNGHRIACKCPICMNMKNSKKIYSKKSNRKTKKRTDDTDSDSSSDEEDKKESIHKKKRGNGHKVNCKCPICKNMRKKKGGDPPDIENQNGDIEEGGIKATTESYITDDETPVTDNETKASTGDYDSLDAAERGEAGLNVVGGGSAELSVVYPAAKALAGGSHKRRKGRKTRKTRKARRYRRRH